jgi:hypothetical protein
MSLRGIVGSMPGSGTTTPSSKNPLTRSIDVERGSGAMDFQQEPARCARLDRGGVEKSEGDERPGRVGREQSPLDEPTVAREQGQAVARKKTEVDREVPNSAPQNGWPAPAKDAPHAQSHQAGCGRMADLVEEHAHAPGHPEREDRAKESPARGVERAHVALHCDRDDDDRRREIQRRSIPACLDPPREPLPARRALRRPALRSGPTLAHPRTIAGRQRPRSIGPKWRAGRHFKHGR